jgi:two-component system copper resistance phosphate regulon response regulator CusR
MRILVVEDDSRISRFLLKGLREENHLVDLVEDGLLAEEKAAFETYDVILLDVLLPGLDGVEVCRSLRKAGIDTPILMLTALDSVADRVRGLDTGADDYLAKPFVFDELLARIRALTRRGRTRHLSSTLGYGPIEIHLNDHRVRVGGNEIDLTATEYRLLEFLVKRAESIVSRDQLAEHVWGGTYDPFSNLADVYIGYLRKKLDGGKTPSLIQTVRGMGYMLRARQDENSGP